MRPLVSATTALACLVAGSTRAAAQDAVHWYELSPAESTVYVVTHRGGVLSFLGHDHAILVRDLAGGVCWAPGHPDGAYGEVAAESAKLEIDTDSARALAGLGGGPSGGQLREIRRKVVDARHLDAPHYPQIRLDSLRVRDPAGPQWVAHGLLTIRDRTRPVEIAFDVLEADSASIRVSGTLGVRQSDFGIRPESIIGVVRVKDEVDIHFDLVARAGPDSCRGLRPSSPPSRAGAGPDGQ